MSNLVLNKDSIFSSDERQEMLELAFSAYREMMRIEKIINQLPPNEQALMQKEQDKPIDELWDVRDKYRDKLPIVSLSRCPFTDEVFSHSIDYLGIDGFWWSRDYYERAREEPLGGNSFTLTGAVSIPEQAPNIPWLCRPGPTNPYLIERLMNFDTVKAVVSHIKIGDLDAYPIVYYSEAEVPREKRGNEWALNIYRYRMRDGEAGTGEYFDAEDQYDFDIAKWIDQKKLLWIHPDDESLQLSTGVQGCPYLDLPGIKETWRTQDGDVWW